MNYEITKEKLNKELKKKLIELKKRVERVVKERAYLIKENRRMKKLLKNKTPKVRKKDLG